MLNRRIWFWSNFLLSVNAQWNPWSGTHEDGYLVQACITIWWIDVIGHHQSSMVECLSPFTDLPMCWWKSKDPVEPLVSKRNKEKDWIHVSMSLNPFSTNPDFFFLNPYPNLHFFLDFFKICREDFKEYFKAQISQVPSKMKMFFRFQQQQISNQLLRGTEREYLHLKNAFQFYCFLCCSNERTDIGMKTQT